MMVRDYIVVRWSACWASPGGRQPRFPGCLCPTSVPCGAPWGKDARKKGDDADGQIERAIGGAA